VFGQVQHHGSERGDVAVNYDRSRPGQVLLQRHGSERSLPAEVAYAFANELDAALKNRRLQAISLSTPWGEQLELERGDAQWMAESLRVCARLAGAESIESPRERELRLRTERAQTRLGAFDDSLSHPVSAITAALDDIWVFFEEIAPIRNMSSREKMTALQTGIRCGYIVSSRDGVYNKTRYATTAEGEAWMRGGDASDYVTTPGAESNVDKAAERARRTERARRIAAQDTALT
jgi:hypothetical protein